MNTTLIMKRIFAGMLGLLLLLASACSSEPEGGLESQSESPSLSSEENGERSENPEEESGFLEVVDTGYGSLFYKNQQYKTSSTGFLFPGEETEPHVLGDYLGRAKEGYDPASPREDGTYPDFTVDVGWEPTGGEVYSIYTVPGYDPGFRLCGAREWEETGEQIGWLILYEYLDEDALRWGGELYQDRLRLKETAVSLKKEPISKEEDAPLPEQWNDFLDALHRAEFQTLTWKQQRDELKGPVMVYVRTRDGILVRLTLFENGWILYCNMREKFLYLEGDLYNQVYEYCYTYYRS